MAEREVRKQQFAAYSQQAKMLGLCSTWGCQQPSTIPGGMCLTHYHEFLRKHGLRPATEAQVNNVFMKEIDKPVALVGKVAIDTHVSVAIPTTTTTTPSPPSAPKKSRKRNKVVSPHTDFWSSIQNRSWADMVDEEMDYSVPLVWFDAN